ncbi:amino acid adenylation domain-containing protein [Paenibacillus mucilaginosus]|nr:amino acid adenylation domain-containing protein [Paenibacillus mucilaginosus]
MFRESENTTVMPTALNYQPLTQPQKRIWYTEKLYPDTSLSTITVTVKMTGSVDLGILKRAINGVIEASDAFRMKMTVKDGSPYQYVEAFLERDFELLDFSQEEEAAAQAEAWVQAQIRRPMAMVEADLYEIVLLKIRPEEYWYSFKMHHIVTDGVGMILSVNRISELYERFSKQEGNPEENRPEWNASYFEFVQSEMNYEASDRYQKDKTYWNEKFRTLPETTGWKVYNPVTLSTESIRETAEISEAAYRGAKAFCEEHKVSLFTFFLAAFYIYMHKVTGGSDIAIGTAYANRTTRKEKETVGMFVSTVATRAVVEPESEITAFMQQVAKEQSSILRHQRYPYNKLIQDLRDLHSFSDVQRLFAVSVQYRTMSWLHPEGIGHVIDTPFAGATGNDFDIHVVDMLDDDRLVLHMDYRIHLFEQAEARQVISQYLALVDALLAQPTARIVDLAWTGSGEQERILHEFNDTHAEYEREQTIHGLIEAQAERVPERTAVVCEGKRLSYRELNRRANSLARSLRDRGVGRDSIVGLMVERSVEMVVGMLGVLKAGGAYVPIDPEYPEGRIRYMLEDSGAGLLLVNRGLERNVSFGGTVLSLDSETLYEGDGDHPEPVSGPSDLAYIIYTSGTTGNPKGVMVEHRGLVNLRTYFETSLGMTEDDVVVQFASFSFDASTWETLMSLFFGAALAVPTSSDIMNSRLFERFVTEHGVTVATLPPSYAVYLEPAAMPSLKKLITAGSAPSLELIQKWKDRVAYYNAYGPTEDSICSTVWDCSSEWVEGRPVSIGRPIANHQVLILDEQLRLLPAGVAGEMCLAGEGLARGYLNRPELTEEKFIAHPLARGGRLYRTGDLARWLPNGMIEYLGRIDHQVKIRGYRIELGEVEAQLMKVPSVQECIVTARDDEAGQKQLAAYFVAEHTLTAGELRGSMARELPGYMIPAHFVQLEQMPLTPNGKIDRRALPAPSAEVQSGNAYAPPRTDMERMLCVLWEKVLGAGKVGIHDHFFELGGDSIKSIQVSSRLFQEGYKLESKEFFQFPTIADLAGRVELLTRTAAQSEVTGEVERTPILEWFLQGEWTDRHHFNQALMVHRAEGFHEEALRRAAAKLAEHHDALRMVYRASEGKLWNRAAGEGELYRLDVLDFRHLKDCAQAIEEKANEIQASINLENGPLLHMGLFRCADGDHLLMAIHHLAVDGVSWRILFEDLASAYDQALAGGEPALPRKTDSFQLWARQLREYANGAALESDRAYAERIARLEPAPLPKDQEQEHALLQDSDMITVVWPEELTSRLLKQANQAYGTEINDLLLTALGQALHSWSGLERVLVNLEGHGREAIVEADISRTVGWFTSQYPVVLEIKAGESLGTSIKRVKEELRSVPNKGIGYGILRYLAPHEGDTLLGMEPEICFNYLGQFDQDLDNSAMRFSPYSTGASVSGRSKRKFALDLNGMITGGALTLTISYSRGQYRSETVQELAGLLQESLQGIVEHCCAQEQRELTPSDLTLKGVSFGELLSLQERISALGELEDVYGLSPMQKGMLFHSLLHGDEGAYFEQASFDVLGRFRPEAFKRALDALVRRHGILRTNFFSGWLEQPVQAVLRSRKAEFRTADLRGLGEAELQEAVRAAAEADKARGFDLEADPLMRVTLLHTGAESFHVLWSFHHLIMDGWCLSLIIREVFETYFAELEGREPALPEARPYSRYIKWLDEQDSGAAAAYWAQYLEGYEQETSLPKSDLIRRTEGYEVRKEAVLLGTELTAKMQAVASRHQVTVNTLLQAAWGVLLQKYNQAQDVVFGSVVSGRPAELPGVETMIGLFINTVPVRVACEADTSFAELLKRTQEQALASRSYESYPLYEIQGLTAQKQDLINHILVFENYPVELRMEQEGGGEGFTLANISMHEQTNYDFNLNVIPGDDLRLELEYNALAYDRANMLRIGGHLVNVLEQVTADPQRRLTDLEVTAAEEKRDLLEAFSGTGAPDALDVPFHVLFEEQVRLTPDHPAVADAVRELTYRELDVRSNALAAKLRECGIGRERLVGILADRSVELLVGVLAVWKAGGAYVPLDPDYPAERIAFMLEDSGAEVLLTQNGLYDVAADGDGGPGPKHVLCLDDPSLYAGAEDQVAANINEPGDLAYVIYTSGTTGRPKGVMIEHRSLVNTALAYRREYRLAEFPVRLLQLASFSFDVFTGDMARTLINGGTMFICPKEDRIDPSGSTAGFTDVRLRSSSRRRRSSSRSWSMRRPPDSTCRRCGCSSLRRIPAAYGITAPCRSASARRSASSTRTASLKRQSTPASMTNRWRSCRKRAMCRSAGPISTHASIFWAAG